MIRDLMYIELKSGYSDDGPAWIGYVKRQKVAKLCILMTMHFKSVREIIQIM